MANELITREDIVRGKQNFDAFDKYLQGSSSEKVQLPTGKLIKTRAGIEKEILDKFPDSKAGMKDVGLSDGDVMAVGSFGLGSNGLAEAKLAGSSTRTQFFAIMGGQAPEEWGVNESVGGVIINRGSRPLAIFFGNRAELKMSHFDSNGWNTPVTVYHNRSRDIYATTTADPANVVVAGTGELQRTTSSRVFKDRIKNLDIEDYRTLLKSVQPVSYHSKNTSDDPDRIWYSFIAEDLVEVDSRLVQLSPVEFYEDTDEEGNTFVNSRDLPEGELAPSGLNLNGIVTMLTRINQYMLDDIEALEAEKTQLKSRMTKLENRLESLEKKFASE